MTPPLHHIREDAVLKIYNNECLPNLLQISLAHLIENVCQELQHHGSRLSAYEVFRAKDIGREIFRRKRHRHGMYQAQV